MPNDHGTISPPEAASTIAISALGDGAAIVSWTDCAEHPARRGFRLLVDGKAVPPPATHCSIDHGGARRHLLAVPVQAMRLARAHLKVVALDGTPVAHADRAGLQAPRPTELDMLAVVPELDPREAIRAVRFLLEIAPSLFRLGRDDGFVAFARALVEGMSEAPEPLAARCCAGPLAFFETATDRAVGDRLTAVLVGRNAVVRLVHAPALLPHPKPQRGLARVAIAAARAQLAAETFVVILGEGGIACRRLPATEPASSAFERAHRDGALDLALRDYIVDALIAVDDPAVPAAALVRELRAATADLRTVAPSGAVSGGVDLVLATTAGTLVLGWLGDPHGVAAALTMRRRERDTHHPIDRLRRFRHPVADRDRAGASGFILVAPPAGQASLLASIQLRLQLGSGESMALGEGPSQIDGEVALARILDALAACPGAETAPPAEVRAVLHALARGAAQSPGFTSEAFGRPAADPRIAIIVPVAGDAELTRCRVAALALDPALGEHAEIIHVVAEPACGDAVAAVLRRAHQVYGNVTRLLTAARRCSPATAINAAIAATKAPLVVVLGAQAMPSGTGWVARLQRELDSNPRAGIVAARRIAGEGSVVDLGFERESGAAGCMPFMPRLAGFPADHADARRTAKVDGCARGAWILRRSLFELVGGLAGDLLTELGTDLDFGCRVRAAGFDLRQAAGIDVLETAVAEPSARDEVALRTDQFALVERWPLHTAEATSAPMPAPGAATARLQPPSTDRAPVAQDSTPRGKRGKRHARR